MKPIVFVLLPMIASAQRPLQPATQGPMRRQAHEPPPRTVQAVDGRIARSTATAFLTTVGTDTFCLEQYRRIGNVISGTWVVLHPPGVFVHDYVITLGDDGLPIRYTMKYRVPSAPTPPDLDSLAVVYGRDSATLEFFVPDSSFTRRLAIHEGFPLLGQSFVGVELALERLREMHADSSTIALHPPSDPAGQATIAPVRFYAGDSVLVGGSIRVHIAPDGSILGLRAGRRELRRVAPFQMSDIVDGFVKAFARRGGADGTVNRTAHVQTLPR